LEIQPDFEFSLKSMEPLILSQKHLSYSILRKISQILGWRVNFFVHSELLLEPSSQWLEIRLAIIIIIIIIIKAATVGAIIVIALVATIAEMNYLWFIYSSQVERSNFKGNIYSWLIHQWSRRFLASDWLLIAVMKAITTKLIHIVHFIINFYRSTQISTTPAEYSLHHWYWRNYLNSVIKVTITIRVVTIIETIWKELIVAEQDIVFVEKAVVSESVLVNLE